MVFNTIAIDVGAQGPNYGVVSACATGTHAIGDAMFFLQGKVDLGDLVDLAEILWLGVNYGVVSACATGTHAIGDAMFFLQVASLAFSPNLASGIIAIDVGAQGPNYSRNAKPAGTHAIGDAMFFRQTGRAVVMLTPQ
ncbi:hypothetical protein T484DRAFT_1823697 [Baffinella frigidus]|nr:hypothetical protein T484DRAFT_1823697 [Cryptophyta sp. CCMP2293]